MTLSVLLRSSLIQSVPGAIIVTLLIDSFTYAVILALRPVFLKLRIDAAFTLRSVALTTAFCMAAALAVTAWAKLVTNLTGWTVPSWSTSQNWVNPWAYYVIIFVSWVVAYFWAAAEDAARNEQQRAIAAEAEALKAELQHLRNQLDPHFLFNALNGIAAEIPERPQAATGMVHELAGFLRYSLDHRDSTLSPLEEEFDSLESYLKIQKARFGDGLDYSMAAPAAALALETPSFLLQPLVENAVKHGFRTGGTPLKIKIQADVSGDELVISVENSGHFSAKENSSGHGIGLSTIRRRLELHYPGRHSFTMNEAGGMVKVQIRLTGRPWSA